MRLIYLVCISMAVVVVGCVGGAPESNDPPDLAEYIAAARNSGLSEGGESSVSEVARFICGQTDLSFKKDEGSGNYWTSFHSLTCPRPGLSPEERAEFIANNKAEIAPIIEALKPLADIDQSGFVTSDEGWRLRSIYEFGMKASYVISVEGAELSAVCTGCNVSIEDLRTKIAEFNRVAVGISSAGIEVVEELPQIEGGGL